MTPQGCAGAAPGGTNRSYVQQVGTYLVHRIKRSVWPAIDSSTQRREASKMGEAQK
jgi:hypothetical protein